MPDNPLAGLKIPSLEKIVDDAIDPLARAGLVDLSNALMRKRLKDHIFRELDHALRFEVNAALLSASERAITHVFKLMKDENYQEKRKKRLLESRERRAKERALQEEKDKAGRIEAIPKPTEDRSSRPRYRGPAKFS